MSCIVLQEVHEHTLAVNRLRPYGWVLDAGCRNWAFSEVVANHGFRVCAIDADPEATNGAPPRLERVYCVALTQNAGRGYFDVGRHPEARRMALESGPRTMPVDTISLKDLMERIGCWYWEAVKLDIEGSEIEVLQNWPGAVAGQITVEFHAHEAPDYAKWLVEVEKAAFRLRDCGYVPVQHAKSQKHCLSVMNYWDSLFVQEELL